MKFADEMMRRTIDKCNDVNQLRVIAKMLLDSRSLHQDTMESILFNWNKVDSKELNEMFEANRSAAAIKNEPKD